MAVCAGRSQVSFVFIVLLVAAVTIVLRVTIFDLGFVTGLALDFLRVGMGALEREVRPFMIEGSFCDRRNIFRPAFVVCVACFAFALLLESPVRPLFLHDVRTNIFVTILAEGILRRLVEPLVALRAVFFPLRMAFDHLPRHQRRLDVVRPGRCGDEHQCAEQTDGQVVG